MVGTLISVLLVVTLVLHFFYLLNHLSPKRDVEKSRQQRKWLNAFPVAKTDDRQDYSVWNFLKDE